MSHLAGTTLIHGGNFHTLMKRNLKVLKGQRFCFIHRNDIIEEWVADVINEGTEILSSLTIFVQFSCAYSDPPPYLM
jgi:hypothetical protein